MKDSQPCKHFLLLPVLWQEYFYFLKTYFLTQMQVLLFSYLAVQIVFQCCDLYLYEPSQYLMVYYSYSISYDSSMPCLPEENFADFFFLCLGWGRSVFMKFVDQRIIQIVFGKIFSKTQEFQQYRILREHSSYIFIFPSTYRLYMLSSHSIRQLCAYSRTSRASSVNLARSNLYSHTLPLFPIIFLVHRHPCFCQLFHFLFQKKLNIFALLIIRNEVVTLQREEIGRSIKQNSSRLVPQPKCNKCIEK